MRSIREGKSTSFSLSNECWTLKTLVENRNPEVFQKGMTEDRKRKKIKKHSFLK